MNDAPEPRSQTKLRLLAVALVMSGCLLGGVGLSALKRNLSDAQALAEATPAPAPDVIPAPGAPASEETTLTDAERAQSDAIAQAEVERRRREASAAPPRPSAPEPPPTPGPPPPEPPPPSPNPAPGRPELNLAPAYGAFNLSNGFTPDPFVLNLTAGGPLNADVISPECRGRIARAPDVQMTYHAFPNLPLTIGVNSEADTTLVISAPDGRWYCDDNGGGGLNPKLSFSTPAGGTYHIWVGSIGTNAARAQLWISEVYR